MTQTIKTFKTYSAALRAANGKPFIRVGTSLYLVVEDDQIGIGLTECSIIGGNGYITGHVTMRHLDRLGNANRALTHELEKRPNKATAFPDQTGLVEPR